MQEKVLRRKRRGAQRLFDDGVHLSIYMPAEMRDHLMDTLAGDAGASAWVREQIAKTMIDETKK